MILTRRDIGRLAVAAAAGTSLRAAEKPDSNFAGVQIGVITYSFRELPGSADEVLGYCLKCGVSAIELMSTVAEGYAGAPVPKGPFGPPPGMGAGRGPGSGAPGRPPAPTPEQLAAREKAEAGMKAWRLAASMDPFKAFRKMYNDAGGEHLRLQARASDVDVGCGVRLYLERSRDAGGQSHHDGVAHR